MDTIALAIMAKSPQSGQAKTRLQPPLNASQAAALAAAFLQDTAALAGQAPARSFIACTPANAREDVAALVGWAAGRVFAQQGDGLSQRCQSAFDYLFQQGARGAVLLGADTPHLRPASLCQAVHLLASPRAANRLVLGPSRDGGYYLIGLRQERRNALPALLSDMPWSTAAVLAETVARARRQGFETVLLPLCDDIDVPEDLRRLATRLASTPPASLAAPATRRILLALASVLGSASLSPSPAQHP